MTFFTDCFLAKRKEIPSRLESLDMGTEDWLLDIKCTGCNECMPCPNGVEIPKIFNLYNKAKVLGNYENKKSNYLNIDKDSRVNACDGCGECVDNCPNNLSVVDRLEETSEFFNK